MASQTMFELELIVKIFVTSGSGWHASWTGFFANL